MADNKDLMINIYQNTSDNPKAPVFKGFTSVAGTVYEIAMWPAKNGKRGSFSGIMKVKQEKPQQQEEVPF